LGQEVPEARITIRGLGKQTINNELDMIGMVEVLFK
jgi:hypothetical protein